jgi:hypothetical protein
MVYLSENPLACYTFPVLRASDIRGVLQERNPCVLQESPVSASIPDKVLGIVCRFYAKIPPLRYWKSASSGPRLLLFTFFPIHQSLPIRCYEIYKLIKRG